jgi:hypothetical protein
MTKTTKIAVVSLSALALIVAAAALNPLRKPEKKIEAALLEITPIGPRLLMSGASLSRKVGLIRNTAGQQDFLSRKQANKVKPLARHQFAAISGHIEASLFRSAPMSQPFGRSMRKIAWLMSGYGKLPTDHELPNPRIHRTGEQQWFSKNV